VLALPFLIALPLFVLSYRFVYISHTARLRTRTIVKLLTQWLRIIAIALCLLSLVPVIVFGSFSNEFVRVAILATTLGYTYWASLHWIVRLLVSFPHCLIRFKGILMHVFVVLFMETCYLREYLIQMACY
jgi:hypothetical protein